MSVGAVKSIVYEKEEEREFTRYFITSLTDIGEFANAVRKHWSIENQLHWCLDVIFREDASRARKDKSPLAQASACSVEPSEIWSFEQEKDDVQGCS